MAQAAPLILAVLAAAVLSASAQDACKSSWWNDGTNRPGCICSTLAANCAVLGKPEFAERATRD
jgi:hypothetical protein